MFSQTKFWRYIPVSGWCFLKTSLFINAVLSAPSDFCNPEREASSHGSKKKLAFKKRKKTINKWFKLPTLEPLLGCGDVNSPNPHQGLCGCARLAQAISEPARDPRL